MIASAVAAIAGAAGLAACAGYTPHSLASEPDLAPAVGRLSVDVSRLRLGPLAAHPFDPAAGLDPTDIAILAVLNSPDLKAKRRLAKVAAAQAFAAGILPDPQLTFTIDVPVPGAQAITAYNINPNLDLLALVTHASALRAARAASDQADLDLLWSEWSAAQQARTLAVTIMADEAKATVLRTIAADLETRYARSRRAYLAHDLIATATSADLAAKLDAESQLATALRDAVKARGDLDALLGLEPSVRLALVSGPQTIVRDPAWLNGALALLPRRRPDLLALQAGYRAQNANLRKAVLTQFPLINLGFSRQRDNTGILSNGLSGSLVIPIFNHARGDIAVQSATRERLAAEYQARLDQTVADVATAQRTRDADAATLRGLEAQVPTLVSMTHEASVAAARGDLDSAAFLALQQSALKQQVVVLDLRLALALADISLDTVLFLPSDESATR
ncbi:MAG: TolC family protein [Caulobacteraceae bacterium]